MAKLDKIKTEELMEDVAFKDQFGNLTEKQAAMLEYALEQQYYKDKNDVLEALTSIFTFLKTEFADSRGNRDSKKLIKSFAQSLTNKDTSKEFLLKFIGPLTDLLDYDAETFEAKKV